MSNNIIEVKNLERNYGRLKAVRGLSLSVPEGSITGMLGPNGAGKTTTLHILIGILRRHGGQVSVMGHDPEQEPVAVKKDTGFVMESPRGEPRFTVKQQLKFHKAFRPGWSDAFEEELLGLFSLKKDKPVYALSRGEQAKLALICALAFKPRLLILDDPTSGLDPLARREFIDSIIRILAEEGSTVLFSTHQVDDIERVADRIVMIQEGREILSDTLENIHHNWCAFRLIFDDITPEAVDIPGMVRWDPMNKEGIAIIKSYSEQSMSSMKSLAQKVVPVDFSLEDIYLEIIRDTTRGEE